MPHTPALIEINAKTMKYNSCNTLLLLLKIQNYNKKCHKSKWSPTTLVVFFRNPTLVIVHFGLAGIYLYV